MLVIYGSWAEISVGRLYMACVFPGLLLAALYMLYVFVVTARHPDYAPTVPEEERAGIPKSKIIGDVAKYTVPPVALIILVLGGIFAGLFTPTEASGVGAFGGCVIAIANKRMTIPALKEATFRTARVCGMIGLIAGAAQCFTSAFLSMGGSRAIADVLAATGLGKWGVLVIVMILLLILGMFVGWMAILMISIPVFGPVMVSYGFDKLWFAVVVCVNLQMSFLTPPYGFALFYMRGITPLVCPDVTMDIVMRSIFPWLGLVMTGIILLCIFPQIALILQTWIYG
jgi:tripartite ATP-independent transporter DctM subunit